jgi:hypothetical protein
MIKQDPVIPETRASTGQRSTLWQHQFHKASTATGRIKPSVGQQCSSSGTKPQSGIALQELDLDAGLRDDVIMINKTVDLAYRRHERPLLPRSTATVLDLYVTTRWQRRAPTRTNGRRKCQRSREGCSLTAGAGVDQWRVSR